MIPPSGEQIELVHDDQRAVVVEVGGGLRTYSVGGRELLDGYAVDELCRSARGQVLIPWPGRIVDGSYEFNRERYQLPLTEPATHTAIHGLVRWANWTPVSRRTDGVVMEHLLHPQPGYPFTLQLRVEYRLAADGLTVRTTAENVGASACPFGAGHHPYFVAPTGRVDDVMFDGEPIGSQVLDDTLTRDAPWALRIDDLTLWADSAWPYLQIFTGDPLPDVARRSLAVEPWTCPPNAFNTGEGLIRLEPGETFAGDWGVRLER
jgi:aldose 1-epimerase